MRILIAVFLLAAVANAQTIDANQPVRTLSAKEKLELRILRVASPTTQFSVFAGAAIDQWQDEPHEWGQGWAAYGKRVASAEGVDLSYNAIGATSDLIFRLDPRYRRMPNAPMTTRIWNAIAQEFVAYKDSGGRMINVSTLSGSYGSAFISNTWEPASENKISDAFVRGSWSIATKTGGNVVREFLPDVLKRFRHSNKAKSPGGAAHP